MRRIFYIKKRFFDFDIKIESDDYFLVNNEVCVCLI